MDIGILFLIVFVLAAGLGITWAVRKVRAF